MTRDDIYDPTATYYNVLLLCAARYLIAGLFTIKLGDDCSDFGDLRMTAVMSEKK